MVFFSAILSTLLRRLTNSANPIAISSPYRPEHPPEQAPEQLCEQRPVQLPVQVLVQLLEQAPEQPEHPEQLPPQDEEQLPTHVAEQFPEQLEQPWLHPLEHVHEHVPPQSKREGVQPENESAALCAFDATCALTRGPVATVFSTVVNRSRICLTLIAITLP